MNYALMGRDQLLEALKNLTKEKEGLEREVSRWTQRVKQLEKRIERARDTLSGHFASTLGPNEEDL